MDLASGHEAHLLEGEEFERLTKHFPSYKTGLVRLSPGGWVYPEQFRKYADQLYNFKVKPSDVYLLTFMKVGTTWTQEIMWTMMFNPNLDNPQQSLPLEERSPFLDADMFFPREISPEFAQAMEPYYKAFYKHCPKGNSDDGTHWQIGAAFPDPRLLKTHLPFSLMPPSLLDVAKVVYVVRSPSDVVASYYHHCRLFTEMKFTGSLDELCELFMNDDLVYSPYWLHVKEAVEKRQHPNMHIILFEDMKTDIMKELRKLNDFMGTKLTEEQLQNVSKHTSFSAMKNRDTLFGFDMSESSAVVDYEVMKNDGGFFRQGKTGDGKKKLSPEMQTKMDEWCKKHFNFGFGY